MATSIHLQHFKIYTVEGEQEGRGGERRRRAVAEQERSEGGRERSVAELARGARAAVAVGLACYGKAST